MIRVAVCEDDPHMAAQLAQQIDMALKQHGIFCEIDLYTTGEELLAQKTQYALLFLDIRMDGINGLETAQRLRKAGGGGFIVFVTALKDYVYDAFEVEASDYLLKPIDRVRFRRMMERICQEINGQGKKRLVVFSKGNACWSVYLHDIYFCEAANHKLYIHTKSRVLECSWKLKKLEQHLDNRFFQCHRSYFINLQYICGYADGLAWMENGERVPVSRLRAHALTQALLQYMKGESDG